MSSTTIALASGQLYALSNSYRLDGLSSFYPTDARGFTAMQAYLALEDGEALLQGTGFPAHQEQVLEQLAVTLGGRRLSLLCSLDLTRIGNSAAIAGRFGVERIYQPSSRGEIPGLWLQLTPHADSKGVDNLASAAVVVMRTGQAIVLGADRAFELLTPPIRLLPNHWVYDVKTRTLTTSDVFTWVTRDHEEDSWVLTDADPDPTTAEDVRRALLGSRYWWLNGANTDRIRIDLAELFESREIETIAPDLGCVLKGRRTVSRHYQLLDQVLAEAKSAKPIGLEVGRWRFATTGSR